MNLSLTAFAVDSNSNYTVFSDKMPPGIPQLRKVRLDILQCSQDMYQTMAVGFMSALSREGRKRGRRKTPWNLKIL
jgi:hypothetical protein